MDVAMQVIQDSIDRYAEKYLRVGP
jgi:hypothetical protein